VFTLIAFDISSDKRRSAVVKALKALARRVQKSVFEASDLGDATFLRLRSELEGLYDPATDRLRYVRLCRTCARRVVGVGVNTPVPDPTDESVVVGDAADDSAPGVG
jgi:CRISPR-associated endonuclease Cas2